MTKDKEILTLKKRNRDLKKRNRDLENENELLKKSRDRARGGTGERYVAELTGGKIAKYKDGHDIEMKNGTRLEVKLSKPHHTSGPTTKRWVWSKVLGSNDSKIFDFLVLLGEKDLRYEKQYPPDLQYVCFLVPRSDVNNIKKSWTSTVALTTNLAGTRAQNAEALKHYLVRSQEQFKGLSPNATAP